MIFDEQLALKPDHYPWTKDFKKALHANPWTDSKFTFSSDVQDFKVHMDDQRREMITRCLTAIAQIEVQVKTFWGKLGDNLPHPSIRGLGYVMANTEVIHEDAYDRLMAELGLEDIYIANLELPVVENRVKYLRKHLHRYYKDSKKQYVYALILFTLYVENVSLFWQFYTIMHFNRFENTLKDTANQVTYTTKEETLHALVGVKLINTIREEYPELFDDEMIEKIRSNCDEAYKAEAALIDWSIGDFESEHLSADISKNFIRNRFNESLAMIKIQPVFDDIDAELLEKTVWFDEDVIGTTRTDFFHAHDTGYSEGQQAFDPADLF